jgi:hypothetical protein
MARRHGAEPVDSPRDVQLRTHRERAERWRQEHNFEAPEKPAHPTMNAPGGGMWPDALDPLYGEES